MEDLSGRTAVVTGGASGIGLALAERFLEQGMNVVVADVEAAALDQAVGRLESSGPVLGVPTDVSDRDQVFALASAAREAFGPVSVLCNNAGVGGASAGAAWERDPPRDWEWIVGVNLWGVVHGVQAFVPDMVERDEGHVVNTASMAGLVMGGILSPYTTTKHAVVGLSKSMYSDLRMRGSHVGVTVLCPGWVRTRIGESARNWPRRLGPPPEPRSAMDLLASGPGSLIAGGMDPAEVAALVLAAVREQRFWLLPNAEEMLPGLRQQTDGMLAGTNPDVGPLG